MHTRLTIALAEIRAAHDYTRKIIVGTPTANWFSMPGGSAGVSIVAWQVGHLAMATYRLAIERIRGRRDSDDAVISPEFLALYGKGSVPTPDASKQPSPTDILAVYDAVYELAMSELPAMSDAALDEQSMKPHQLFTTKHGSLTWCARHEMLHAGQIGLLRRQLGGEPLR